MAGGDLRLPLPIYPPEREAEARLALRSSPSNICQFWVIYLPTGETLGATNYAQPVWDAMLNLWHRADLGAGPSAVQESLSPGNSGQSNLKLFFLAESLSEAIAGSGVLDGARWEHFFAPPDLRWRMPKGAGWIADVSQGGDNGPGAINLSFVGLEEILAGDILETTGTMCRYELGDERCQVNVNGLDRNGRAIRKTGLSVSGVGNGSSISRSPKRSLYCPSLSEPEGHWAGARIQFSTGANSNWGWFPIERSGPGNNTGAGALGWIELSLALPSPIQIGDQFEVWAGCDKTLLGDCKERYNNVRRFGGENDIPQETVYEKEKNDHI